MKYFLVGALLVQALVAVQLTPMTYEIKSIKKRNITYSVKNTEKELAAAECKVLKVVGHDKQGREIREETQDVVLYPSQLVLQPLETKGIRVNYTRNSLPKKEAVYRVLATQLALNLQEDAARKDVKAGMKFIFSYEGLLFVGGTSVNKRLITEVHEDRPNSLALDMTNSSTKSSFVHVKHYDFIAHTNKGEVKLAAKDFGKFGGIRLLPDETFRLHIAKSGSLKGLTVKTIVVEKIAQ